MPYIVRFDYVKVWIDKWLLIDITERAEKRFPSLSKADIAAKEMVKKNQGNRAEVFRVGENNRETLELIWEWNGGQIVVEEERKWKRERQEA
jgi:hypothetical protein